MNERTLAVVILMCGILVVLLFSVAFACKESFEELRGKVPKSAFKLRGRSSINPNIRGFVSDGKLLFDDIPVSPDIIDKANDFHRRYMQDSKRRREDLETVYKDLGSPPVVVTLFYCSAFAPLFQNWLESCEAKNIDVRKYTIAFCLDKESYDLTMGLGVKAILIPNKMSGTYTKFGEKSFGETMFYKNAFIYDILTTLPCNVLFQDSDLIWFKDPVPYLEGLDVDVAIMYDGPNFYYRHIYANTGFIYLKNNERTKSLMETALGNMSYVLSLGGHQKPFVRILDAFERHGVLKLTILPEDTFPNGHLHEVGPNAYVYHYSWTEDISHKIKKLTKLGFRFSPALDALEVRTS